MLFSSSHSKSGWQLVQNGNQGVRLDDSPVKRKKAEKQRSASAEGGSRMDDEATGGDDSLPRSMPESPGSRSHYGDFYW